MTEKWNSVWLFEGIFELRARSPAAYSGVSPLTIFLAGIGDSSLLAARSFNCPPILLESPLNRRK